jgi:peptidoglycan hydrolase-like protein with peptidoglycan-binding domain
MELVRRSGWGAAAPRGKPIVIPAPVRDLFLHHSAGPDGGPDTVRSIQRFHQDTRGWADIAYTWLYSPRDRVFYEGRGPGVAGAHTRGHNRTAHALCILGNYQTSVLPRHAIEDLADFAAWHGTTWGPPSYRPHNDVAATLCPGKHVLNVIRDINLYAAAEHRPQPTQPQPQDLPRTLRRGDSGDDVKLLQAAVLAHDGMFGSQTEQAVRAYQARNGLTVDGICGPATWRSILGA